MSHNITITRSIDLSEMRVEYNDGIGSIYLGDQHYFSLNGCDHITEFKNRAVEYFSNRIDECLANVLSMTFPYTVGDITFNSLSEINAYILGTQAKMK